MNRWTKEEVEILKENYNKLSNENLTKLFPNKSFQAIYKKAYHLGLRKTSDIEFLNRSEVRKGEKCSSWKGGKKKSKDGHILILKKGHPMADSNGYLFEHRYIMSEHLGRLLTEDEVVHHKNGIKDDNRIENLEIMTIGEHTKLHHTGTKCSDETRKILSQKAKERLQDETKHPSYKQIDIQRCQCERELGKTVSQICKENGITRKTYYNKLRKQEVVNE